jgi:hypothetical protein
VQAAVAVIVSGEAGISGLGEKAKDADQLRVCNGSKKDSLLRLPLIILAITGVGFAILAWTKVRGLTPTPTTSNLVLKRVKLPGIAAPKMTQAR